MLSFIHISDLHIGKRLSGYELHDDQEYMLRELVSIIEERKPDAVFIAGDVYDRINPAEESTALLSGFLERLQSGSSEIFVIAGNHDPEEKLSYLSNIVDKSGLHIQGRFSGVLEKRSIGNSDIYMLPYIRIADVRRYFPDNPIDSLSDAIKLVLDSVSVDKERINVLVAHQAVLGAVTGGSEDVSIGGETPIPSSVFSSFDYVALGHIHRAQPVGVKSVRYSGSMLKYSVAEREGKVVLYGKISDDGSLDIEEIKLKPLHDVVIRKGSFSEIMSGGSTDDYVHVILTDERDIPDALSSLSALFPRFLSLEYDNARTRSFSDSIVIGGDESERTPDEYFAELFEMMTRKKMSDEQKAVLDESIREIWGDA